jgi:O-antigen ligase
MGLVELTTDEAGEGGNTARVALYQTAVAIARDDFPLGVGLGRYGSGLSRDPYSPVYHEYGLDTVRGMSVEFSDFIADAFWARVLGETGVIGFAALILFCAALAVELWRATRQSHAEPLIVAFVLGAWMVFVQALAETVASSMFESPPRVYLLFGATGIALSLARIHERAK